MLQNMLENFLFNGFWTNALANAVGTIVGTLAASVLVFYISEPLRRWIYEHDPKLSLILLKILDFLRQPLLWVATFAVLQAMILLDIQRLWSVVVSSIILLGFYRSSKSEAKAYPSRSSQFSEEFPKIEDIERHWVTITGKPTLDEGRGKPKPSLCLSMADPPQATNTFLILKELTADRGEIECDFLLEPKALLNVVFLCDKENHNWHMARYDSREGTTDGFLIKDAGKGNNWRFDNMSTSRTGTGTWYRARIEFNSERARMFKNGELVAEITNPRMFGGHIGLFNECANVSVDNFKFSKG